MSNSEIVYARPNADSKDPSQRGHITSGWTEGNMINSYIGDQLVEQKQAVRSDLDTLYVPLDEHLRLQNIMGILATKYGNMPGSMIPSNSPETIASTPSATQTPELIEGAPWKMRERAAESARSSQPEVPQAPKESIPSAASSVNETASEPYAHPPFYRL